jgi:hypothetical protein
LGEPNEKSIHPVESTHHQAHSLTQSLEIALKRLRLPHEVVHVWANGICINQQDLVERESQVKLMHGIYTRARQVVVRLGPDQKNSASKAFDSIRDYGRPNSQSVKQMGQNPATYWPSIDELSQLPYFERIWVRRSSYVYIKADPVPPGDPRSLTEW